MISLFDWYNQETQDLHYSLKQSGLEMPTIILEETGFLPDDVTTPYSYFCQWNQKGKPRYFNEIPIETFDEIKANNNGGEIYDEEVQKARIIFQTPGTTDRTVKEVLYHERGNEQHPYARDHYNRYGFRYAQTIYDQEGHASMKFYYNSKGEVIITENLLIGDVILNHQGQVYQFERKLDFIMFYLEVAGFNVDRIIYNSLATSFLVTLNMPNRLGQDVLFWHEKLANPHELPGNMQFIIEGNSYTNRIFFQVKEDYEVVKEQYHSEFAQLDYLGYVYPFVRDNQGRKDILIMTNSDQIESLDTLVKDLPDYRFHIGALTEMSAKLMAYQHYDNVALYPNISPQDIDKVFAKCDIYLDINYGNEILDALRRAFLNNMLIFGFNETVHNRKYIMEENIFEKQALDKLVEKLKVSDVAASVKEQRNAVGNMDGVRFNSIFE